MSVNSAPGAHVDVSIAQGAVPLVATVRGGLTESVHLGHAVVLSPGEEPAVYGQADHSMFGRSTAKAFQGLAMVEAGLSLPPHLLAVVCSSHSGEAVHRAGVVEVLRRHGLGVDALQNTPSLPIGDPERSQWVAAGNGPASITQDCSGKHAGMLATCVVNGWSVDGYLQADHPLQVHIRAVMSAWCGSGEQVSVDGCGAPLFSHTLMGLARGYAAIASAEAGTPAGAVYQAMSAHSHMVGGTGRVVTDIALALPGFIAKDGAEAVLAMASPTGHAAAFKILDGGPRALGPVAWSIIDAWGAGGEHLEHALAVPVLGHGRPVGGLVALLP